MNETTTYSIISTSHQDETIEAAFLYWNDKVDGKMTEGKMVKAWFSSVGPFLITLILLLAGLTIASKLFHLKRKLKRKQADKLILYSENEGRFQKISVVDEMKRRMIRTNCIVNYHQHQIIKPIPDDFNLPDESKVPEILIKEKQFQNGEVYRNDLFRINADAHHKFSLDPNTFNVNTDNTADLSKTPTKEIVSIDLSSLNEFPILTFQRIPSPIKNMSRCKSKPSDLFKLQSNVSDTPVAKPNEIKSEQNRFSIQKVQFNIENNEKEIKY